MATPCLPPGSVHQSEEPTPQDILRMWPYWYWYKYPPVYLTAQSQPSNAYLAFLSIYTLSLTVGSGLCDP
jgi:hypothetical protein